MKRMVMLVFMVLTLSSCAGQRPPTREELLEIRKVADATRTRVYAAPPEQVLSAAARVFEESDTDYRPMGQTENSTAYRRDWLLYMVFAVMVGQDNWKVTATPAEGGTRVEVINWQGPQGGGFIPITSGGGSEHDYTIHPSLYTLYHERLAYMLGDRDDWVSCKTAEARLKDNPDRQRVDPLHALCSLTVDKATVER